MNEPIPTPHASGRVIARAFVLFAFLALVVLGAWLFARGAGAARDAAAELTDITLTETVVRERVLASIQREAQDAFLVTGRLEVIATTEVANAKTLLPGLAGGIDLGTTRATVRVPGTIHYGIPVAALDPASIRVDEDGRVHLAVGRPVVKAVEPHLEEMEVRTEVGWARLYARSGRRVERRAIELIDSALRSQGSEHLSRSREALLATARALALVLGPALAAAGLEDPRFQVDLPGLSVRVDPSGAVSNNPSPPPPHPMG